MSIALTLRGYLEENDINYDVVKHQPTVCSLDSAEAAHIPGDQLAKSVIFKDEIDYLMAIVPSTSHVKMHNLDREFNSHFRLVNEAEIESIFDDCESGAIPPVGQAYYIDMVVDNELMGKDDIYFEAGDHTSLIHMSGDSFKLLVSDSRHCDIV